MPWAESRIFREWIADSLAPAAGFTGRWDPGGAVPLENGDYMVALFDDSITPDETVARPGTAYRGGVWTAGEVTDSADVNWPAGGQPLTNLAYASAGQAVVLAADQVGGPGLGPVTLAGAVGDLLYFTDVSGGAPLLADQGAAFHYFGGPQTVVGGFFTIAWSPLGVMLVTI
jgi:hypothetical protein